MKTIASAPALVEIMRRYAWYCQTHAERGCMGEDAAVARTPGGRLYMIGTCRCACPDHPCKAPDAAPDCTVCRDTGFIRRQVPRSDPAFGKVVPCPACNAPGAPIAADELLARSGIEPALRDLTLDRLVGNIPRHPVTGWVESSHQTYPFLVLTGRPGTGKTHTAIGACLALIARGVPVWYTPVPDLLDAVKATYAEGSLRTEGQVLATPYQVPALALDDLLSEYVTEWSTAKLQQILDLRWRRQMLTIITTNATPRDVPRDRFWSRVFGSAHALVITTVGRDRRFQEG